MFFSRSEVARSEVEAARPSLLRHIKQESSTRSSTKPLPSEAHRPSRTTSLHGSARGGPQCPGREASSGARGLERGLNLVSMTRMWEATTGHLKLDRIKNSSFSFPLPLFSLAHFEFLCGESFSCAASEAVASLTTGAGAADRVAQTRLHRPRRRRRRRRRRRPSLRTRSSRPRSPPAGSPSPATSSPKGSLTSSSRIKNPSRRLKAEAASWGNSSRRSGRKQ